MRADSRKTPEVVEEIGNAWAKYLASITPPAGIYCYGATADGVSTIQAPQYQALPASCSLPLTVKPDLSMGIVGLGYLAYVTTCVWSGMRSVGFGKSMSEKFHEKHPVVAKVLLTEEKLGKILRDAFPSSSKKDRQRRAVVSSLIAWQLEMFAPYQIALWDFKPSKSEINEIKTCLSIIIDPAPFKGKVFAESDEAHILTTKSHPIIKAKDIRRRAADRLMYLRGQKYLRKRSSSWSTAFANVLGLGRCERDELSLHYELHSKR